MLTSCQLKSYYRDQTCVSSNCVKNVILNPLQNSNNRLTSKCESLETSNPAGICTISSHNEHTLPYLAGFVAYVSVNDVYSTKRRCRARLKVD